VLSCNIDAPPPSVFDQHNHQRFALVNSIVFLVLYDRYSHSTSFLTLCLLNWSVGDGVLCWRCMVDWENGLFNPNPGRGWRCLMRGAEKNGGGVPE
jgi:hypothetical protein